MKCEQVQQELAIALLGKGTLDSATVEHIANCPACAAEQASLRPVVTLLASISEVDVEPISDELEADELLLARLLNRVALEQKQDRRRSRFNVAAVLAVAASATALALASLAGVFGPQEHSIVASATGSGITATADIEPSQSGSDITIHISGVARNTNCRLQVVGADGERETIVTWVADYFGTATTSGKTSLSPSEIRSVTVREVGGPVLLTVPVQA